MKKLFKTVAVVAAALAVGLLASCKTEVSSGSKFSVVGNGDRDLSNAKGTVYLDLSDSNKKIPEKFKAGIDWFCWTEGNTSDRGPIVKSVTVTQDGNAYSGKNLPYGHKYVFTLNGYSGDTAKKHDYIFYMYQNKSGKVNPEDMDSVGVVKVYEDKPSKIYMEDSGWKQVAKQGEVYFNLDEPLTNVSFFQNGDYSIQEVLPLVTNPKKAGQYIIYDELKYDLKDNLFKKADGTKGFLFPEGQQIITTYQPGRGTGNNTGIKVTTEKDNKGNITSVKKDAVNGHDILPEEVEFKKAEYWGVEITVKAHEASQKVTLFKQDSWKETADYTLNKIPTSRFPKKFARLDKTDFDPRSSVVGATIVEEVPAVYGDK